MLNITQLVTPQVQEVIKIFAIFLALFHFVVFVIMYQQVYGISRIVRTRNGQVFLFLGLLQTLVLAAILFLIIFY